jgi:hypothetical protein
VEGVSGCGDLGLGPLGMLWWHYATRPLPRPVVRPPLRYACRDCDREKRLAGLRGFGIELAPDGFFDVTGGAFIIIGERLDRFTSFIPLGNNGRGNARPY